MADDKKGKDDKKAAPAVAGAPKPEVKKVVKKEAKKSAKKTSKKWKLYEISGSTVKKARHSCPKCGEAVFLAHHANRDSCGKCGYTEFKKK
jgi:small subunit ribosomal protein S27Ae